MRAAAQILRRKADEYARLMAEEMGKPYRQGVSEAQKCAHGCDFFAENASQFLARESVKTEAHKSFVAFRPLGVILAIMPWNFPFWQVFRFAAPSLMAGNAVVLKHASNVPGCALAIESIFREAGFPRDLYRNLLLGGRSVEAMVEHPAVRAITLTGSGGAGRAVAGKAGSLLKKTVLELGGSDPYVVLDDADLDAAPADVHPSVPDVWRGESVEREEQQRSKDMQERFDTLRIELEAALDRRIRVAVDQMRTTFDLEIEALRTLNREEANRIRAANDEAFVRIRVSNTAELERIRGAIDEGVARLCTVLEGQLDRVWGANDVELERIRSYGADRLAEVHDLLMHKIERLREERSAMEPAQALEEAQAAVETRRWLRRRGVTAPH